MAGNGDIQPTQYAVLPKDTRRSSRLLVISGGQIQQYDLLAMGKERILFGRDNAECDIAIANTIVSLVQGN